MRSTTGHRADARGEGRFTSVLVPVDGSPQSEGAIATAAQLDVDRIVLMRVARGEPIDPEPPTSGVYGAWQREQDDAIAAYLQRLADAHADAARGIETLVRYGDAAEEIISEARNHDIVVMSSTGRGAAGRLLFGSTADRVVRHGATPVMVVRVGANGVAAVRAERVVVPLDGSALAEHALPLAERLARMLQAPVHLVRSVGMEEVLATLRASRAGTDASPVDSTGDPYEVARERTDAEAQRYLDRMREGLDVEGLTVTVDVLSGSAAFELLWTVRPSDIVVMTSRGQGGYQRWLVGSVAEKLVREAKAPVLLVPVPRQSAGEG